MGERLAGVLLHPTALPGPHGVGDLGPAAGRWLDWLAEAGQAVWQVLPLSPVDAAGSPYGGPSATAGEPLLISLERLRRERLLEPRALAAEPPFASGRVDLERVRRWRGELLRWAWTAFRRLPRDAPLAAEHAAWAAAPDQRSWLEDWSLYAALRERHGGPWTGWPAGICDRDEAALADARRELASEIAFHRFVQFLFWRQWAALRRHAAGCGVRILGDLPMYAALDSVEVWTRRELFDLDRQGRPRHVSGVPPDAYSDTGQLWGHPLYRWDRLRREGYAWWIERLRLACRRCDLVRLDHFRGFAGYWEVPAGAATAAEGRWRRGPGRSLFTAAERLLGRLPLVAEDLGHITADVRKLRRALGIPGMRVLQFGFQPGGEEHLPRCWQPDHLGYTATHDSDTSRGWFAGLDPDERRRVLDELGGDGEEISWTMIRAALHSRAGIALVPLQDLLGLGSEARFNSPGTVGGNWTWRFDWPQLAPRIGRRLRRLTALARRLPPTSGAQPLPPPSSARRTSPSG